MLYRKTKFLPSVILSIVVISGCATTQSNDPRDPWEGWNRKVQSFNDGLDNHAMKTVAKGYRWIMPTFVDKGISNFFSNIDDIGVTLNDLFQAKFSQSGMDVSRFLINSTAGIGGLFDIASMINLPKHREDFGQTLGVWGVPTGPYMVLPFFGPNSPRGLTGLVGDAAMNPISYTGFYVSSGFYTVNAIDTRADNLGTVKIADEAAAFGRYEFYRDAYIGQRKFLVLDGNVPEDEEYILNENFGEDNSLGPVHPF